jgi:hypothetical protein
MVPTSGVAPADLEGFDRRVRTADPTRPIVGREVLKTSIGDAHAFADPHSLVRAAYEKQLVRSRADRRPLMVGEIASLPELAPDDLRALLETFDRDAIVGFGGLLLETAMLESGRFALSWPSPSGPDARPVALDGLVQDVVNWSDSSRSSFTPTAFGRLVSTIAPQALGTTAAPLAFVRSPELIVVAPPACGGRGYALAAPLAGAGGVERATLLDPQGKGWLVLTEPGTYRVRLACDEDLAVTVEARGRPFSGKPGFDHLQEVRLDAGR